MKYKIPKRDEASGAERRYRAAKWFIFALVLLMCYVLMRAGIFVKWQPVLLIPLSAAVAMYEDELSSCIFALFCGFMTDIAFGFTLGFSAVWLMGICVAGALLVRNLIRVNLVNFLIIALTAIVVEFSMDYLFNVLLWNVPRGDVILTASIIPTAIATFVTSPAMYYLVRTVEERLGTESVNVVYYEEPTDDEEEGDGKE